MAKKWPKCKNTETKNAAVRPEVDRGVAGAVFAAPKADPPIDVGMIPRLGGQEGVLGPRARLGEEAA